MQIQVIIVIENKLQGDFLKLLFDSERFSITMFFDGKEALDFLLSNQQPEAVVVMSYQLPSMNGIQIMQATVEARLDYGYLFLTSDKTVERAIEALKAGAYEFLPKSNKIQEDLIPLVEKVYIRKQRRVEQAKIKKELEEKSQAIANSINYAKRIQGALLPPLEFINYLFPSNFIFFKPRDVVSGDFYWATQRDHMTIIAAADCTGHGVPGAFMSMLGITGLNQIVHYEFSDIATLKAESILNRLREFVTKSLRQTGKSGEAQDGMDIALCVINTSNNTASFAGANNPLYLVRNNELLIIDGDPMPIGIHKKHNHSFTGHEISLQNNDHLYLFSDGYMDQFGGSEGKKFLAKNFKSLILSLFDKPCMEQHQILDTTLSNWQGERKQVDDILVMGFVYHLEQSLQRNENISFEGKTILIAEDDEQSAMLLQFALEETNAIVLRVKDGKEAFDLCKTEQPIDLILMDINMPRMDGNEAMQRIKEIRPNCKIIVQTAYYQFGEKEKSFKAGCDDYIAKPIDIDKLIEMIKKHIPQ